MRREFRWNDWNLEHATRHGVSVWEAEHVVRGARRPFPRRVRDDKWHVIGRGLGDRLVQVAYMIDRDGTYYVIHAMPVTVRRRRGSR